MAGAMNIWLLIEGAHLAARASKSSRAERTPAFNRNEWMAKASACSTPPPRFVTATAQGSYSEEGSNESYLGLSDQIFARIAATLPGHALDHMRWHRTALVSSTKFSPRPASSSRPASIATTSRAFGAS